eukprot:CAMPEP_0170537350 /NCGR_PEP_ID=MMETSP0209-20121228/102664_1 /TAXON_ID=665100 ORGANISM="Litonotus pictus, Strain P1" /NCGR_SAMPLE_ID=MMETSP0209 /ASSEMBLY_ACC=CAM_ASM_000301 /LENGTH=312 /DNA_ID=CAMNT_0010838833 /DNA_START=195 /DNA_END=1130 /DNA_ORIENTATION=-
MTIKLDEDPDIRNDFQFFLEDKIRYGKLLEILDLFSVLSILKHLGLNKDQVTLVTASVSAIKFYEQIPVSKPLTINSYITMVGKSSIENRIDLYSGDTNEKSFLGSAFFTMVARDPVDYKKPSVVPPLNLDLLGKLDQLYPKDYNIDLEEEYKNLKLRCELGLLNKEVHKSEATNSLYKKSPSQSEVDELHKIFLYKKNDWDFMSKTISVDQTMTEKVVLMFNQHMNYNGHIFGGFLMREAVELSYACLKLFDSRLEYTIMEIDSVTFYKPVMISSIAQFKAFVTYKQDNIIHTVVEIFNIVSEQREKDFNL